MEIQVTMFEESDTIKVGLITINTHFAGFILMPSLDDEGAGSYFDFPQGRYKVHFKKPDKDDKYDMAYNFEWFCGHIIVSSFTRDIHGTLWSGSKVHFPNRQMLLLDTYPNIFTISSFEKECKFSYNRASELYKDLHILIKNAFDRNERVELVVNNLSNLISHHVLYPDIPIGNEHQGKLEFENK